MSAGAILGGALALATIAALAEAIVRRGRHRPLADAMRTGARSPYKPELGMGATDTNLVDARFDLDAAVHAASKSGADTARDRRAR